MRGEIHGKHYMTEFISEMKRKIFTVIVILLIGCVTIMYKRCLF